MKRTASGFAALALTAGLSFSGPADSADYVLLGSLVGTWFDLQDPSCTITFNSNNTIDYEDCSRWRFVAYDVGDLFDKVGQHYSASAKIFGDRAIITGFLQFPLTNIGFTLQRR